VHERLPVGGWPVVLHGIGGVGKTQLAIEYTYRFAADYDIAWWITAEQDGLIGEQFAALSAELGCVQVGSSSDAVRHACLPSCGRASVGC
jgi:KaiC/GvpD/RAD55 family RecA-like ATPase